MLRNRQRDIPNTGLWSIFIGSSDRITAIKLASVLRLSLSFTHVVMCKCHYFQIKIHETYSLLSIVTQLFTNLPMCYCNPCVHPLLPLHILGHKNLARLITTHSCQVFLMSPSPLCEILARVHCCLQVQDFSFIFHFSCYDKDIVDEKFGKHVRLCIILYIKLKGGLFVCLFVCLYLIQIHIFEPIPTKLCTHLPLRLEETVGYVWSENV